MRVIDNRWAAVTLLSPFDEDTVCATRTGRTGASRLDRVWIASVAMSLLLLVCFFWVRYLPMVNLPQHAALLGVWTHAGDPSFPETRHFFVNWRTPYLTAYVIARLLTPWTGVIPALKLVIWLSAVGHQVAFAMLVKQRSYPRWLMLFGLPLALGYSFFFGFVSFTLGVTLAIFALCAALWHRDQPTIHRGIALGTMLCTTEISHGFALALAVVLTGPVLLRGPGPWLARLWPFLLPAALHVLWFMPGEATKIIGATTWEPRLYDVISIPALLFGASAADHCASVFGVAALALVSASLGLPNRAVECWTPLVLLLLGYCLFPIALRGFGPLHPRFVALMLPALLIAFQPRRRELTAQAPRLALGFCVAWFAVLVLRFVAFDHEAQPIAAFIARMPKGLRVRPVVFERDSKSIPGLPALLHLSAYYAAEKGGIQGYSFAMYPNNVIRYVNTFKFGMGSGQEWAPEQFSAATELSNYDCILIHSRSDRTLELFGARTADVTLEFHESEWWAYRVRSA